MRLRHTLLILMMIPVLLFGQSKDSYIYGKITDDNGSVLELVNIIRRLVKFKRSIRTVSSCRHSS